LSRKPKTPLLTFLQRACHAAIVCESAGISFAELEERRFNLHRRRQERRRQEQEQQQQGPSNPFGRRDFLKGAGVAAFGGLLLTAPRWAQAAQAGRNVVIVGGGIAGLNAAYQLGKRGVRATVYEAGSGDSWGRIRTRRDDANRLTAELGGEFIDTGHEDMRQLATEFGLPLIDVTDKANLGRLTKDSYFFGGRHYSEAEVVKRFRQVAGKIKAAAAALPEEVSYKAKALPRAAVELDNTSLEKYLAETLGLRSDWLYDLLATAYTSEFGLDIGEQSTLNFLTMISTDLSRGFEIFGESDERFKIRGGNDRLITALRKRLEGQIETGRELTEIRQQQNWTYTLHFANGPEANADFLVLAIPFKTLREVKLSRVALTKTKREAIHRLGYGTNSKLLLDLSSRVWRQRHHRAGYLFSEQVQNGWDNAQGQGQNRGPGGYTVFLGGDAGRELSGRQADTYLDNLEAAFPGFRQAHTGTEAINWSKEDFSKASYACYKQGQWTTLSGVEFEPDGNMHFCGEHCSGDYQGYMNGGAETGRRAAAAVLRKMRVGVRR
jgi:monoamine oxidase